MANWRKQKFNKYELGEDEANRLNDKYNVSGSSYSDVINIFNPADFDALLDLTGDKPLFFTNPNKDGDVKESTLLNKISKHFRENVMPKYSNANITEGFELNPAVFMWEWIIDVYNSRLVLREATNGTIDVWFYKGKEDAQATFDYGLHYKNNEIFMINLEGFIDIAEKLTKPEFKNKKLNLYKVA